MTDPRLWEALFMIGMMLGIPVTFIIAFTYRVKITRKYLKDMMAEIKSSPDLTALMKTYDFRFSKRIFIPGLLHGAVTQTRFVSIGLISVEDAKNFPEHFRRLLAKDARLQRIGIGWFLVAGLLAYIS